MRVACYVRVSTTEQAKEGYSIGEQVERLQDYCKAMQWTVYKVYTDAGFTGANTNRPALQSLLLDIRENKIDKVIVYKLDRLSRSQKDTLMLIEDEFLKHDCDFVSMSENFDTSTPFGRAMIGILAVFSQLEREQIKERMTMGKDARAKEGKWKGGTPPVGYKYVNGELIVDDFTAMQVRELFTLFNSGMPLRTIETVFKNKGFSYGSDWTPKQMRRTLQCKTYIGLLKHKDTWHEGSHEHIIDNETFEKAQIILKDRQKAYKSSGIIPREQTTLLGGLIWCAQCGARYGKCTTGKHSTKLYYNYSCYSRHKKVKAMIKNPNCKNKIWRVQDLDDIVLGEIKKLALDDSYFDQISRPSNDSDQRAILESQLQEIESQISRFLDLYGHGKFSIKQLDNKMISLEEQKNKIYATLESLDVASERLSKTETMEIIKTLDEALKSANFEETRDIINALINRIEIDNEDITIFWNFS